MKLIILEEVETASELVDLLQHIAGLIEGGNTSGYHPGWRIEQA
ncbi:hypothetical protein LCGC14_0467450 [marine sediment metagenome]|uniref:Uncharacterized protein n=1 Tax=marine sediment metagenome TaxID=412755 RepID=A0A0F9SW85_9ZZZZ